MTATEFQKLLLKKEGQQSEWKSTLPDAFRLARTLVAFANTSGGVLLVGVKDSGEVCGVASELRELTVLQQAVELHTEPELAITYEALWFNEKRVLVVRVAESDHKPLAAIDPNGNRTIYVRVKDKTTPTKQLLLPPPDQPLAPAMKHHNVKTVLNFLRKNDTITSDKTAALVNISDYRATKLLREMTQNGLLISIDHPRPVRYALKN